MVIVCPLGCDVFLPELGLTRIYFPLQHPFFTLFPRLPPALETERRKSRTSEADEWTCASLFSSLYKYVSLPDLSSYVAAPSSERGDPIIHSTTPFSLGPHLTRVILDAYISDDLIPQYLYKKLDDPLRYRANDRIK
jgi:hypothetical protein